MNYVQLSPIREINIEGFQVVSGGLFCQRAWNMRMTCTLWQNEIFFSKYAVAALNNCECVRIEVNPAKRCLLIVPVTSSDRDGIHWIKDTKDGIESRKMECRQFATPLFETWGWEKDCVYRTTGQLVTSDKKVMLLYNFTDPEKWKTKKQHT